MENESREENIGLLDIVDLDFLQDFQDAFANSTNVASIMVDNTGPITKPSNFTDFCIKYTRGSQEGYRRCNECDIKWGKLAAEKGEPVIYSCHSGLTDFAVPIMLKGKHIASILGGQVLTHEPDENHFRKIAKELGVNENEYIEALKKINIVPEDQVKAAAQLLFLTANSISQIAHKNYELIEKIRNDNFLNKAVETIRSSVNINDIENKFVTKIGKMLDADRVFISRFNSNNDSFLPILKTSEYLSSPDIPSIANTNVDRLKAYEDIFIEKGFIEFSKLEDFIQEYKDKIDEEFLHECGMKSGFAMPIVYMNGMYGIFGVHFTRKNHNFSDNEKTLIKILADQTGIALYQTELLQEKEQIAENESTLRRVMLSSSSIFNFEQIINSIVTETGKLFGADRCFFVETDKSTNANRPIKPYAEYVSSPNILSHTKVVPTKSDTEVFINLGKTQKIICVENINEINLPAATKHMLIDELSVKSYMIVTVKYDETIYGAMVLHYVNEHKKFSPNDISMAEAMANQSANIINQVKTYDEMQKTLERENLLRNIFETMRSSLDINTIKNKIVTEIGKSLNMDMCFIMIYNQNENYFDIDEHSEYRSSTNEKSFIGENNKIPAFGFFMKSFKNNEEVNFTDVEEYITKNNLQNTPEEEFLRSHRIKSSYNIPVYYANTLLGFIITFYTKDYRILDKNELDFLRTIGTQAGIALHQAKLYKIMKIQTEREKAILSNLPFMVWLKDRDSRFLAINEPYAKMCGRTIDNIIGKTDYDFFPKENADLYIADDKEVMKLGKTKSAEELIQGPDGAKWHETYKTPIFDEKGQVTGTVGFARDITERKEIDKIKNEFVSTVSHELRTPLTSLSGAIELVLGGKMGEFSDKIRSLLNMAYNNSIRLTNLINDILDIEKIEAGKMDFEIKTLELMPLVNQAVQLNHQFAQKFNVEIKLMEASPNVFVQVDSDRLTQVLTNLLSNAIKFSLPNSYVEISVFRVNDNVRISVTNYGAEIPQAFKNKIFQKFAQADSSDSRQKGGTGLGLNISKLIIEKMNGQIDFVSKNNKTTFYFDLPEFINKQKGTIDEKTSINM